VNTMMMMMKGTAASPAAPPPPPPRKAARRQLDFNAIPVAHVAPLPPLNMMQLDDNDDDDLEDYLVNVEEGDDDIFEEPHEPLQSELALVVEVLIKILMLIQQAADIIARN